MELGHNPAGKFVERAAHVAHEVGVTALEMFDQDRMVRRLRTEHEDDDLEQAVETMEVARDQGLSDVVRIQRMHILRIFIRSTIRSMEDADFMQEGRVLLIKQMLHDDGGEPLDMADLGLTHAEMSLLGRYI